MNPSLVLLLAATLADARQSWKPHEPQGGTWAAETFERGCDFPAVELSEREAFMLISSGDLPSRLPLAHSLRDSPLLVRVLRDGAAAEPNAAFRSATTKQVLKEASGHYTVGIDYPSGDHPPTHNWGVSSLREYMEEFVEHWELHCLMCLRCFGTEEGT